MAAAYGLARIDFHELWIDVLNRVEALGDSAVWVFAGIYVAATVLLLPSTLLDLGAGAIFGVVKGALLVSTAALAGASASFLIARYLLRGWLLERLGHDKRFHRIDHATEVHGWKIVGLSRLSPLFPFWLLNYVFGLTRVPFAHFLLATWLGMLPLAVAYAYVGSFAVNLATLGSGERSPVEWAIYGVGFVTTAALTIVIARWARAAFEADLEET